MIAVIGGVPHIQPCGAIPPDGFEGFGVTIADTYAVLTHHLPLRGCAMLRRGRAGDVPRLVTALRDEAPWMAPVIERIGDEAAMAIWAGRPWLAFRPLLLVGAPGAGKTHFARRLGKLSGCGSAMLSLAGVSSNAEIAGNPRGFRHQQPCFPALAMQRTGTANPVLILDEIDKSASGTMGDVIASLLPLLERSTAACFYDGCLSTEIDLAHVNYVLIANSVARLPAALLSRVDVVNVTGPGPEHAEVVLAAIWRDVARDAGMPPSALPGLEAAAETMLLRLFHRTRSVRRLRRAVETVVAVSARHTRHVIH